MSVSSRTGVAVLVTAGLAALSLQAPAMAHHKPGHTGGPGSNCDKPQYPPKQCQDKHASVDDNTLRRGQSFRFTAQGFAAQSPTTIRMHSTPVLLGISVADPFQFVEATLTTPSNASLGPHSVVATGLGADGLPLTLSVPVTVVAAGAVGAAPSGEVPGSDAPGGNAGAGGTTSAGGAGRGAAAGAGIGLPQTGTAIAGAALAGMVLVGAGGAAVVAGRRRRDQLA